MAIERIQVIYCDAHQAKGEKVEGTHFKLNLNGENMKVDLCADCETEYFASVHELFRLMKPPAKKKSTPKRKGPDSAVVREWAEANGYDVPARGRVPADIVAAYEAAN